MAETYQFRQGYRGTAKVPADIVLAELEHLRTTGDLTAERTVEAAKPKDAPLHPAFEWNDRVAATEFRLQQARLLIRAVVIVPDRESEGDKTPRSAFVHVPDRESKQGKYSPLSIVAEDLDEYERALTEAQRYLDSAEHRFHELRRLAETKGGKTEMLAIAIQGFATVREAMELLR